MLNWQMTVDIRRNPQWLFLFTWNHFLSLEVQNCSKRNSQLIIYWNKHCVSPSPPVQSTVTRLIKCSQIDQTTYPEAPGNTLTRWRPPYTTVIWYSANIKMELFQFGINCSPFVDHPVRNEQFMIHSRFKTSGKAFFLLCRINFDQVS